MSFVNGDPIRLDQFAAHTAAFLLAALVPSIFLVWPLIPALPLAFIVTLAHVITLALPLYLALSGYTDRLTNLVSSTTAGFCIGAVPLLLLSLPVYGLSLQAGLLPLWTGVLGALGGFVFWLTLKCCGCFDYQRPSNVRRNAVTLAFMAIVILLTIGLLNESRYAMVVG